MNKSVNFCSLEAILGLKQGVVLAQVVTALDC